MIEPLTKDLVTAYVVVFMLLIILIPLRAGMVFFKTGRGQKGIFRAITSVFLRGLMAIGIILYLTFKHPIVRRTQILSKRYQEQGKTRKEDIRASSVNLVGGLIHHGTTLLYEMDQIEKNYAYENPSDREKVNEMRQQILSSMIVYTEVASNNLQLHKKHVQMVKRPLLEYTELLKLPAPEVRTIQKNIHAVVQRIQQTAMTSFIPPIGATTRKQTKNQIQVRKKIMKPAQIQLARKVHTTSEQTRHLLRQIQDVADQVALIPFRTLPARVEQITDKEEKKGLLERGIDQYAPQSIKNVFYSGIQTLRSQLPSYLELKNIPESTIVMAGDFLRQSLRHSTGHWEDHLFKMKTKINEMGSTLISIFDKAQSYNKQALEHAMLVLITMYGLDEVVYFIFFVLWAFIQSKNFIVDRLTPDHHLPAHQLVRRYIKKSR